MGILENFFSSLASLFLYLTECILKCIDEVLTHTNIIRILVIPSNEIPEVISYLELRDFLRNFGCKLSFYVQKLASSVLIGCNSLSRPSPYLSCGIV